MIDYSQLAPGIRDVVRWLNYRGWSTTDSGDGTSEMECAVVEPMVNIEMALPCNLPAQAERLALDLASFGVRMNICGRRVEAHYSTADGVAGLLLFGVTSKDVSR